MTANPIDDLPTELLCQVFDYLNHQQQQTAKLACVRWSNVLSRDQYIRQSRLILSSSNLCEANGTSIQQMKRYRAFMIDDSEKSNRDDFLQALQKFLSCKKVAETVEEIQLDLHCLTISDLFGCDQEELYMPRLRQIGLRPRNCMRNAMRCQLRAPNLRNVLIGDPSITDTSLEMYYDLYPTVIDVHQFQIFDLFGAATFANLCNLTLTPGCGEFFYETGISTAHRQMFGQLRYLKIVDGDDLYYSSYRIIFQAAKNLKTLIVYGGEMSEEAFHEIGLLTNLHELTLMVYIELGDFNRTLRLPQLEMLTTCFGTLAPPLSVPRLTSMSLRNFAEYGGFGILAKYFNTLFSYNCLETLELYGIDVDKTAVSQICTFINLKSLKIIGCDIGPNEVRRIVTTLEKLRYLRIERCTLQHDDYCAKTKDMPFFSELRYLNDHCLISDIDNQICIRILSKTTYLEHYDRFVSSLIVIFLLWVLELMVYRN